MKNKKPVIAITMGDPSGIGPEIILKTLQDPSVYKKCSPFVIGHAFILKETAFQLGMSVQISKLEEGSAIHPQPGLLFLIEPDASLNKLSPGVPTPDGGKAAGRYIEAGARLALSGTIDAITTAPINKETLKNAGFPYPGHTEFFAALSKTKDYGMMLAGGPFRIIFTTIHEPIFRIPALIKKETVLRTIRLLHREMDRLFGIPRPQIGIASLNPHGGENGLFGNEELNEIIPAVQTAREEGILVTGPLSPDALFHQAYHRKYDAVVVMYHDQGMIPLKMIAFKRAVNITLGLPFIRTSVDHGTAYDIAGKGIADPSSLKEALSLAAKLSKMKKQKDHDRS